jgi:hypothetical protein
VTNDAHDIPSTRKNRRTIHSTCHTHKGPIGFCNLRVTRVDGGIVFDPHVASVCVVSLGEDEAEVLRDTLTEWLG